MNDRDAYLDEYNSDEAITHYGSKTAGQGIDYNLTHEYGRVYAEVIARIARNKPSNEPFRVLEYGCGAGMNLLWIMRHLQEQGLVIGEGIGADFSETLIKAAEGERRELPASLAGADIRFVVASNEALITDLAEGLACAPDALRGRFDLVLGVNTFRYAIRLQHGQACAEDITALLRPGGYSIMIDMNSKFPLFRSRVSDRLGKPLSQYWLPSLEQYAAPFEEAGLRTVDRRNFCWIPHSAGRVGLTVMRALTPVLNQVASSYAMRSLVVSQKPVEGTQPDRG